MGRLVLITGGARSGKSSFAEDMARAWGENILYIATSIPFDDEMKLRVKKHRERRPVQWETLEAYREMHTCLEGRLNKKDGVLLDCVTIMVSNLMLDDITDLDKIDGEKAEFIEKKITVEIEKLLNAIERSPIPFILVTNETGMGIVPEYPCGRLFRDIAGRINQMLAKASDEVYFCVSGIPIKIK